MLSRRNLWTSILIVPGMMLAILIYRAGVDRYGVASSFNGIPDEENILRPITTMPTEGLIHWCYFYDSFPFFRWKFVATGTTEMRHEELTAWIDNLTIEQNIPTVSVSLGSSSGGSHFKFSPDNSTTSPLTYDVGPDLNESHTSFQIQSVDYRLMINEQTGAFMWLVIPNDEE